MAPNELNRGMRAVYDAVVAEVGEIADWKWSYDQAVTPTVAPESVTMRASLKGRHAEVRFSREQLEDSADRVDRSDVRAAVQDICARLTGT